MKDRTGVEKMLNAMYLTIIQTEPDEIEFLLKYIKLICKKVQI